MFHQNYRLYLFNQGRYQEILDVERFAIKELSLCVPGISALTYRNFQKLFFFSFLFQTCFSQRLQNGIPPS